MDVLSAPGALPVNELLCDLITSCGELCARGSAGQHHGSPLAAQPHVLTQRARPDDAVKVAQSERLVDPSLHRSRRSFSSCVSTTMAPPRKEGLLERLGRLCTASGLQEVRRKSALHHACATSGGCRLAPSRPPCSSGETNVPQASPTTVAHAPRYSHLSHLPGQLQHRVSPALRLDGAGSFSAPVCVWLRRRVCRQRTGSVWSKKNRRGGA